MTLDEARLNLADRIESYLNQVKIENAGTVLELAHLNGNPPMTEEHLGEAVDAVLTEWSAEMADDDGLRLQVGELITELVLPHLNRKNEDV